MMSDSYFFVVIFPFLACLLYIIAFCYLYIDDFSFLDFLSNFDFNFFKFEVF